MHAQYIHNASVCVAAVIPPRVLHFSAIHCYYVTIIMCIPIYNDCVDKQFG